MSGLYRIQEPRKSTQSRWSAVGIDLGTTNSLIATVDEQGKPRLLADADGRTLLPSVVEYGAEGTVVGTSADKNSPNTLSSTKRWMGRSAADLPHEALFSRFLPDEPVPTVATAAGKKNALNVAADILSTLYQRALTPPVRQPSMPRDWPVCRCYVCSMSLPPRPWPMA